MIVSITTFPFGFFPFGSSNLAVGLASSSSNRSSCSTAKSLIGHKAKTAGKHSEMQSENGEKVYRLDKDGRKKRITINFPYRNEKNTTTSGTNRGGKRTPTRTNTRKSNSGNQRTTRKPHRQCSPTGNRKSRKNTRMTGNEYPRTSYHKYGTKWYKEPPGYETSYQNQNWNGYETAASKR